MKATSVHRPREQEPSITLGRAGGGNADAAAWPGRALLLPPPGSGLDETYRRALCEQRDAAEAQPGPSAEAPGLLWGSWAAVSPTCGSRPACPNPSRVSRARASAPGRHTAQGPGEELRDFTSKSTGPWASRVRSDQCSLRDPMRLQTQNSKTGRRCRGPPHRDVHTPPSSERITSPARVLLSVLRGPGGSWASDGQSAAEGRIPTRGRGWWRGRRGRGSSETPSRCLLPARTPSRPSAASASRRLAGAELSGQASALGASTPRRARGPLDLWRTPPHLPAPGGPGAQAPLRGGSPVPSSASGWVPARTVRVWKSFQREHG